MKIMSVKYRAKQYCLALLTLTFFLQGTLLQAHFDMEKQKGLAVAEACVAGISYFAAIKSKKMINDRLKDTNQKIFALVLKKGEKALESEEYQELKSQKKKLQFYSLGVVGLYGLTAAAAVSGIVRASRILEVNHAQNIQTNNRPNNNSYGTATENNTGLVYDTPVYIGYIGNLSTFECFHLSCNKSTSPAFDMDMLSKEKANELYRYIHRDFHFWRRYQYSRDDDGWEYCEGLKEFIVYATEINEIGKKALRTRACPFLEERMLSEMESDAISIALKHNKVIYPQIVKYYKQLTAYTRAVILNEIDHSFANCKKEVADCVDLVVQLIHVRESLGKLANIGRGGGTLMAINGVQVEVQMLDVDNFDSNNSADKIHARKKNRQMIIKQSISRINRLKKRLQAKVEGITGKTRNQIHQEIKRVAANMTGFRISPHSGWTADAEESRKIDEALAY